MKRRIINGFLMATLLVGAVGTTVSCKDTDEDAIADLRGQLQRENASLKEVLEAQIKGLQSQVSVLESAKAACESELADVKTRLAAVEKAIKESHYLTKEEADKYYVKIEAYLEKITELETAIRKLDGVLGDIRNLQEKDIDLERQINDVNIIAAQAAADAQEALRLARASELRLNNLETTVGAMSDFAQRITDLETAVAGFNSFITTWTPALTQLIQDVATAKSNAETAKNKADELERQLNAHIQACGGSSPVDLQPLWDKVNELRADLNKLEKKVDDNLIAAKRFTTDAIDALKGAGFTYSTLGAFQRAFEQYCTDNGNRLDKIEADVAKIKAQVAALNQSMADQVTGIIIQGTVNPVLGYMNLPFDTRSTMLAAFCGENGGTAVKFPSVNPSAYVSDDQVVNDWEIDNLLASFNPLAIAGANERVYDFDPDDKEKGAYAGTLYVTVNPNTVDFTGKKLTLENSVAEQSPMTLSPLQPSDYKLSFGWTRAGNNNGFYEAKAYVKEADIPSLSARVDMDAIKDVAKDVLDNKNGVNLTQMATTIYSTLSDVLDAYAVKASYPSYTIDENNNVVEKQENNIFSNYNLALTTIKPLSYKFSTNGLPTGVLSKRIATIGNITIEFNQNINVDVNVTGATSVPVTGTVTIPAQNVSDGHGGTITIPAQNAVFNTTVELRDILEDYADDIAGSMESQVNNMIANLQNQVNGKLNEYTAKANNYINKVNKVLDRFEGFVKNIDSKLQPVLLFVNNGKYTRINDAYLVPTKLQLAGSGQSAVTLVATSYTGELLAPACKKLVAVTNVIRYEGGVKKTAQNGDAKCMEALNYVNSNGGGMLGKVVSGSVRDFPFVVKADYADYIFEVSYFAVDFSGVNSRVKSYIQPVR